MLTDLATIGPDPVVLLLCASVPLVQMARGPACEILAPGQPAGAGKLVGDGLGENCEWNDVGNMPSRGVVKE